MAKTAIVYWSGTGNTEEMAKAIQRGTRKAGAEAPLFAVDSFGVDVQKKWSEEGNPMFQKTDFWIGLAVGAVAGIFGYRFMQEREQQLAAMQPAAPTAELPIAELQRQKEELEDLIAAQEAKK